MGVEEGTSYGDRTDGGPRCLKSEAMNNWSGIGNDGGDGCSGTSEDVRTYKRRKQTRSSSESKNQEDLRGSVEAASKLAAQTIKEPCDHLPASTNVSADVSLRQWRTLILTCMIQSLSNDVGGMQQCILDALTMTVKGSDSPDENSPKFSTQTGKTHGGSQYAAKSHLGVMPNGTLDESRPCTVTEMCQRAFLSIILSEKFTSLCKVLCENFHGMKTDNFFRLSLIHNRMKEGAYESTPALFSADIQQIWKNLEAVGTELISLAKSLSDVSETCYKEQVEGSQHYAFEGGKHEGSESNGKSEHLEACDMLKGCTCRNCGKKADGSAYLVCDSCEELHHLSCIDIAIKDIPPIWFCGSCISQGMGSRHGNCVVCEELDGSGVEFNQAGHKISTTNEETFQCDEYEEATTFGTDNGPLLLNVSQYVSKCKICAAPVKEGEKLKICHHVYCPYRYYHVRCLSPKQSKLYGPHWYCPSCLCRICLIDGNDEMVVLCDGCDHAYHLYCVSPPLDSPPKGKWFCRQCDAKIKEIHRAKSVYEGCKKARQRRRPVIRNKLKKSDVDKKDEENIEKKQNRKCEDESDKGREGMDILLNAALNYDEKFSGESTKS